MRDLKEVREQTMQIPGEECFRQRDSTCKGPEVGVCLVCWRKSRKARRDGQEMRSERELHRVVLRIQSL